MPCVLLKSHSTGAFLRLFGPLYELSELHRDRNCRTLCHTGRGVSKTDTPDKLLVIRYGDMEG